MNTRLARYSALVALVLGELALGSNVSAAADVRVSTWFGQVERHQGHYDYVGRPCPEQDSVCADCIAHYRIVPTTAQAERGLRRAAGHPARLWGELLPARDAGHQGTLRVFRVERKKAPEPQPAAAQPAAARSEARIR